MYAALMIDLKNSRDYGGASRQRIQQYLLELTRALNDVFSPVLSRRVEFSAGDELQGLFDSAPAAYLYYRLFDLLVSPVRIRAGIGVGSWDVQIPGAGTTAQDGKAYHNARRAIEAASESEDYDILLCSGTALDRGINGLIGTGAVMTGALSEYQKDLLLLAELCVPLTVLGVPEPKQVEGLLDMMRRRSLEFGLWEDGDTPRRAKLAIAALPEPGWSIPVPLETKGDALFPNWARQRGMASRISRILGVSRQSVEKSLKNADLYPIRNLAGCALEQLIQLMEEEEP